MIILTNAAGQQTIPMQGRHLKWLNDGQSFLEHVSELDTIGLRAVCGRCVAADVADPLRVRDDPVRHVVEFACGCGKAGRIKTDRPLDVPQLLVALGWVLVCATCGEPVQGDNPLAATRYTVDCSCTTRVYTLAVA